MQIITEKRILSLESILQITGERILEFIIEFAIALLIIFLSFRLISFLSRKAEKKFLSGKKYDKTLVKTLIYLSRIGLKLLVIIASVGYLGIDTSGFAALITSIGVGIGLAVNGALSNFAGGAILLITRPFEVDDYIESSGLSGTVEEIHIINTRLRTPDNKTVYIPNGILSSSTIINYSAKDKRRVDLLFRIGSKDDFKKAEKIIEDALLSHPSVIKDGEITVKIKAQGRGNTPIIARAWVNTEDYWKVFFEITETVKTEFDKSGFAPKGEFVSIENE